MAMVTLPQGPAPVCPGWQPWGSPFLQAARRRCDHSVHCPRGFTAFLKLLLCSTAGHRVSQAELLIL